MRSGERSGAKKWTDERVLLCLSLHWRNWGSRKRQHRMTGEHNYCDAAFVFVVVVMNIFLLLPWPYPHSFDSRHESPPPPPQTHSCKGGFLFSPLTDCATYIWFLLGPTINTYSL
ncbi:hypothetical protein, unlikely [Trypanosoma brucei gambiense DAL972]|uniref:Uncharacterized protein n=1 Tax=Trypanosoma brucei gambiense (strain MHOM/CI/86/DAL972) TaxID=679716 RepID=C9ZP28_TRYB9|nr:hypothetical protein, unlikely [Trypanosoma brucei gambiense DAL972]CBH11156.1 hypothetical protein, unlikely [Trypanosoma brucei gambiense DAL972]|eukprot:XP_011773443.1 hypothetical protein, unlikely [Trypanosoma brucei gambiense DAL972]